MFLHGYFLLSVMFLKALTSTIILGSLEPWSKVADFFVFFLLTAVQQFLLFSSQLAVRGIPFNLSTQEDVIIPVTGTPSYFVGIDFYAQEDTIFYSDTIKDIIYKQKTDGTGKMQISLFWLPPLPILASWTEQEKMGNNRFWSHWFRLQSKTVVLKEQK